MKVLLVDDSRVMRQLVRRTLRHAGFSFDKVFEAPDGAAALKMLRRMKPDLVLSDWNMPNMTGIDLLRALRAEGNDVKLGFVTSESTPEMRAMAMKEGACFLLTKPFTSENMRMALGEVGFRPQDGVIRSEPKTHKAHKLVEFGPEPLAEVLSSMANRKVTLTPGGRVNRRATPCVTARWVSDHGELLYVGFCEMPLAASFGAALGLRPPSAVAQMLKAGKIPEELHGDTREVFNVLSRVFNDAGSEHTLLEDVLFPPAKVPIEIIKLDRRPPARKDFMVTIEGFGAGKLSILSVDPNFIRLMEETAA